VLELAGFQPRTEVIDFSDARGSASRVVRLKAGAVKIRMPGDVQIVKVKTVASPQAPAATDAGPPTGKRPRYGRFDER
jgi:hypothetical protein